MFTEKVVTICRHRDLEWFDAMNCMCRQCGRNGEWLDGFMLWVRKQKAVDVVPISATSVGNVAVQLEAV